MNPRTGKISQADFIFSYFHDHPNEDLTTTSVVDWATEEWYRLNSTRFKDPDRAIRKLAELGLVEQLGKGLYRYTPNYIVPIEDRPKPKRTGPTTAEKMRRCAACGLGEVTGTAVEPVQISASTPATMLLCRRHADLFRRTGALDLCTNFFAALANEAHGRGDQDLVKFCHRVVEDIQAFTTAQSS